MEGPVGVGALHFSGHGQFSFLERWHLPRSGIDAAQPAYPCLIDRDHHVAELYDLVNVPESIWAPMVPWDTMTRKK